METMELTHDISETQLQLLAVAAANVAGGRHEFRADSAIRQESKALVSELRKAKRNEAKRETYKWRNVGERFAFDIGYDETMSDRISEWQDILKSRPFTETHIRNIARALFNPRAFERANSDAENVEEYRMHVLANWRAEIRQYREWQDAVSAVGMTIPLSLADMRADHGSRFFNYACKKWTLAGYGEFLFGANVEDAFQTALAECIENGDWINPSGDGRVKGNRVPLYGALWRHVALAVRRAVWANTRFTYDAAEPEFDWSEWEKTANESYANLRFTANGTSQSLAEWAEYDEWREIRSATEATRERIKSERETRIAMLDASRSAIAQLVLSGMTVQRIANMLGRTVDGLSKDLTEDDSMRPAMRFLPNRQRTMSEDAERVRVAEAEAKHAELLRMRYADMQADNYANGRVFRRASGSSRSALAFTLASEETRLAHNPGSVVSPGSGYMRTVAA